MFLDIKWFVLMTVLVFVILGLALLAVLAGSKSMSFSLLLLGGVVLLSWMLLELQTGLSEKRRETFLERLHHVYMKKSITVKESGLKFSPGVQLREALALQKLEQRLGARKKREEEVAAIFLGGTANGRSNR